MNDLKEWQYLLVPVLAIVAFAFGLKANKPEYEVERFARLFNNSPESARQTPSGRFSARAEGSTLVIELDGVPTGNGIYDEKGARFAAYAFACDGGVIQELLDDGATLRFEPRTNTGRPIAPLELSECPEG